MGSTNSKNPKEQKIKHQRFQSAKIINQQQIQIELRTTLDDYNTWKSNIKKINSFNKQNILFPINYSFQLEGWCSENTGIVKITYDNYQFVLQQELQNRITLQRHLSQQEMWYLLFTLVSISKDFSYLNRKVGDIRPHNIFVSQPGQIKSAVCFSWPNQINNFQKTINDKQITYLSPQQMEICKNNKMDIVLNLIIAESFSIGLTLLHAGLLFNFSSIYNLQKLQINKKLLSQKIQDWMNLQFFDQNNNRISYSQPLKLIVKNLCEFNPQKRESSIEIFNLLQPHKQAILNIEPFVLQYSKDSKKYVPVQKEPFLHLQKSMGLPVYNYTQISNKMIRSDTPYAINQNLDWSTRVFTQVPTISNTKQTHYQLFQRYANGSGSKKNEDFNIKLTNTINQRQSLSNKPSYFAESSPYQPGVITVKPFTTFRQETYANIHTPQIYSKNLQGNIQKKVQSKNFINYTSPEKIQENYMQVNKIKQWKSGLEYDPSEFLRKIDVQLQRSKNMFPS